MHEPDSPNNCGYRYGYALAHALATRTIYCNTIQPANQQQPLQALNRLPLSHQDEIFMQPQERTWNLIHSSCKALKPEHSLRGTEA